MTITRQLNEVLTECSNTRASMDQMDALHKMRLVAVTSQMHAVQKELQEQRKVLDGFHVHHEQDEDTYERVIQQEFQVMKQAFELKSQAAQEKIEMMETHYLTQIQ
jgi:hypothetical protein